MSPPLILAGLAAAHGLVIGALAGLASAFSSGPGASVRCVVCVAIPMFLARVIVGTCIDKNPWFGPLPTEALFLAEGVAGVSASLAMVYLGTLRLRKTKDIQGGERS